MKPRKRHWASGLVLVLLFLAALMLCGQTIAAVSSSHPNVPLLPEPAAGLLPFYRSLLDLEKGKARKPVVIVHLGDSHTAGGWFPGQLRRRFQKRFGDAGAGMMPPGIPYRYYQPVKGLVTQSNGWKFLSSLKQSGHTLFGLTGFRADAAAAGQWMQYETYETDGFDRVWLEVAEQPGGGAFSVVVDGRVIQTEKTANARVQIRMVEVIPGPGARRLKIQTLDRGKISLLSWTFARSRPGIVYESQGVIGASVNIIDRWDPSVVTWELARRRPSLIVLEYGVNEGFEDRLDSASYRRDFQKRLALLRRGASDASILILGPPDARRLPDYCSGNRFQPVYCRDIAIERGGGSPDVCLSLTAEGAEQYGRLLSRQSPCLCGWHTPPNLSVVREIQRGIARQGGLPFWDWSSLMPEPCGIGDWLGMSPPLAASDHVHLLPAGYEQSADTLFDVLMDYYDRFRKEETNAGEVKP